MIEDTQLLRDYAEDRSEAAFAELVRRHLDLVYSAALRQANGDAHLAEDATQVVFTDLARKARSLADRAVLAGWLHTSTRFAVSKLVRGEQRRRRREQEAQLMNELVDDPAANLEWEQVRPVLDEAIASLGEADREAVLLRFFEGRDFATIGAKLNLPENTARMRASRALDKLHAELGRRGVTSSMAALGVVLANQAVVAAPAGLVATVTGNALAGGASAGVGLITTFMTMNKITGAIAGVIVVAGVTGFVSQSSSHQQLHAELAELHAESREIAALQTENSRLARIAAEIEDMRRDDTAMVLLGKEADALKTRMIVAKRRVAEADAARETYAAPKLDRMPKPVSRARPNYPPELASSGVDGEVLVEFTVDNTGIVRNPTIVSSSQREFEASAIEAISQWKFEPGEKSGRAVNTRMQVPLVWKMAPAAGTPVVSDPTAVVAKP